MEISNETSGCPSTKCKKLYLTIMDIHGHKHPY